MHSTPTGTISKTIKIAKHTVDNTHKLDYSIHPLPCYRIQNHTVEKDPDRNIRVFIFIYRRLPPALLHIPKSQGRKFCQMILVRSAGQGAGILCAFIRTLDTLKHKLSLLTYLF